ncbi:MAG: hypothetical protein GX979_06425 [Firmicutes bacterium]|nr:hypothetical protein [Bacillota bacterium]
MHFIKLWIRSYEKPLTFPVAEAAWGRFKRAFQAKKDGFFIFATVDGRTLALNLECVQLAQVWMEDQGQGLEPMEGPDVMLHFSGGNAMSFEASDPTDLARIYTNLKVGMEDATLSFVDQAGKLVIVDIDELIFLEASTSFVEEGFKQIYLQERGTLPPR